MKKYLLLIAIAALSGCATNNWHWDKSGADEQVYNMDMGQCRAQALSGTGGYVNAGTIMILNSCMQGKGWYQVPNR